MSGFQISAQLGLQDHLEFNPAGLSRPVFLPASLGFDTASWPINPRIFDPGGLALAVGDAGITPEALFDSQSQARANPAVQYWVGAPGSSPTSSDSNSGLSAATPLASITKAIQLASASGQSSARVNIMAGEYPRALGPVGTAPTIDIAFVAYGGRAVTGTYDISAPSRSMAPIRTAIRWR